MQAFSDIRPLRFEAIGGGLNKYRWDIQEVPVDAPEGEEPRTQWAWKEVDVYDTVTKASLKSAVIAEIWPPATESKLMNESNTSSEGREAYNNFLIERERILLSIDAFWLDKESAQRTLAVAIKQKLFEIKVYDLSPNVNSFLLNGNPIWIRAEDRPLLQSTIDAAKRQGIEVVPFTLRGLPSFNVPIELGQTILDSIQLYAMQAAAVTAQHQVAVQSLETIAEVDSYDFTQGYPAKPEYTLPS